MVACMHACWFEFLCSECKYIFVRDTVLGVFRNFDDGTSVLDVRNVSPAPSVCICIKKKVMTNNFLHLTS